MTSRPPRDLSINNLVVEGKAVIGFLRAKNLVVGRTIANDSDIPPAVTVTVTSLPSYTILVNSSVNIGALVVICSSIRIDGTWPRLAVIGTLPTRFAAPGDMTVNAVVSGGLSEFGVAVISESGNVTLILDRDLAIGTVVDVSGAYVIN